MDGQNGGFALSAIAFAALMTAGSDVPDQSADFELTGTTWRAETIMGRPVIDSLASSITFEADAGARPGRLQPLLRRGDDRRRAGVVRRAVGATKMACAPALMDQEARFFQALESAERWSVDEHGLLFIHSAAADEPRRFAPFED